MLALKQELQLQTIETESKRQRMLEMTEFLNEQGDDLLEFDDQLVRRLVEKITIYDDKISIEFKSGVDINIKI